MTSVRRRKPWKPATATTKIREKAKSSNFLIRWTGHARDQMRVRDLIMSDVIYVLKNGNVYDEAVVSTQPGLFRYSVESGTPNSNNRLVRVIAIPSPEGADIKVVTVMWRDEPYQS